MTESIVRDEVLNSIRFINESVGDSVISVFDSIIQEYDKLSTMMDNAEDDWMFIQEGQVWDTATGKGKVESGLFKLIAFIPRLFQGMFNAIVSVFKKDSDKDVTKNAELAKNVLSTADANRLNDIASGVKQSTEDNIGFDPNKKEFVLKKGFKHIRNWIFMVFGFRRLFEKFIIKLKGGETPYDSMVRELEEVLKGNKSLDSESFYVSIDTLNELFQDGHKASMGLRGLTSELSMLLEKKMRADFENGKNIEKQADAKKVLDKISNASRIVMGVTFFGKMVSKAFYVIGGPMYRKFRKGKLDEEDVEKNNASQEVKDLENKLKGLKDEYKSLTIDKKRKDKKRKRILELEKEISNLEKKMGKAEDKVITAIDTDVAGDESWRDPINPSDPNSKKKHKLTDYDGNEYNPITKPKIMRPRDWFHH